ncbi:MULTISPECIES: erythromycin esterase family protein [unclassified Solwaraspora]|uniref:erythromycin esterase family protein n=1 Tax=unclassified Solwaraspora TaxID=2627926 RepID=UPI00248BF777|nr:MULTISPECIES: erythromycin esterase family protein [unclassified Solwaraspora]WBB99519.1 erythromycin esterase family protein [Solwaraspora sp. WMMA2059]WBC21931.1 erythromycin esterase family protein [Solwaraspora sp. WMMA2080]WJK36023.1 erythromycin esterase family protein [Solwaraspora sp. WMMA2065]
MDITDTARPADAAGISAFLRSLPARPLLLGLGEARHFVEELGQLRNDIFRHLVAHEGYRSIAVESDCLMGLVVDEYVTAGTGTLDDVMRHGFSHQFGTSPANRDLVSWMRAYNTDHDDKLRFHGFDGPLEYWAASPRQALTGLHDLLDDPPPGTRDTLDSLLGPDDRWSDPATVTDPSRSIGRSADAQQLRLITDDLLALLDTQAPQLDPADRERAELYGRTAVGLLRYHHAMADPSPARIARLSALRDAMMAANLRAVADHGPALVFAHNLHLQRNRSVMSLGDQQLRMWSAGAITAARLGDRYAYLASALGTLGDDTPPPDTVEGALATLPWDTCLVDARRLARTLTAAVPRVSPDFAYFPLDPAQLDTVDSVVFVNHVPRPGTPR